MQRATVTFALAGVALGAAAGAGAGLALANRRPEPIDLVEAARALAASLPRLTWPRREPTPEAGRRKGNYKLTYYWMAAEPRARGGRTVQLYNKRCRPVARVSRWFARRLRMEGGGKLRDGRVLTYSGRCRCPTSPCYRNARRGHRWGTGVRERPLSPFRSVAVDPRHVAIGSVLYIPELDGLTMPGSAPWGGFVHDGCVIADDQGGGVRGRQVDLFAARKRHYLALNRRHRLKRVSVFEGGERCSSLSRPAVSRRGSI